MSYRLLRNVLVEVKDCIATFLAVVQIERVKPIGFMSVVSLTLVLFCSNSKI
jgi:hypothetical protein